MILVYSAPKAARCSIVCARSFSFWELFSPCNLCVLCGVSRRFTTEAQRTSEVAQRKSINRDTETQSGCNTLAEIELRKLGEVVVLGLVYKTYAAR
jgi:hypothetical protein